MVSDFFLLSSTKHAKLKYMRSKNIEQTQSWENLKKLFKVV